MELLRGNKIVTPIELMKIPVGSVILVGKKLPEAAAKWDDSEGGSVWFVFDEGKAVVVDDNYPDSETEDLDWFEPWEVTIIGFNQEYVNGF
jgi:hypothetical protein